MDATKRSAATLETLADEWEKSLYRADKNPNTLATYRTAVMDLLRFLAYQGATTRADLVWPQGHELLERWRNNQGARGLDPGTRKLYAVGAQSFIKWCGFEDGDRRLELEALADEWGRWLQDAGKAAKTVSAYRDSMNGLLRFLIENQATTAADLRWPAGKDLLKGWQHSMVTRGLSLNTRANYVAVAKSWIRWLLAEDHLDDRRLDLVLLRPATPRGLPRPIPEDDLKQIAAFLLPRYPGMSLMNLRNRALWWWLISTGCRVSEALQLRREQVDSALVWQKGNTQKRVDVPLSAASMVREYLAARKDNCPWMWVTHDTVRQVHQLDYAGVREAMRKVASQCGVTPFKVHQIRHSTGTALADNGQDALDIASYLGHKGLNHVMTYAKVSPARRARSTQIMENFMVGPPPPPPANKSTPIRQPARIDAGWSRAQPVPAAPVVPIPLTPTRTQAPVEVDDWSITAARL
jgi:site-specific recombinase XerD